MVQTNNVDEGTYIVCLKVIGIVQATSIDSQNGENQTAKHAIDGLK